MEPSVLQKYKKAGEIAKKVKIFIRNTIKPDVTLLEIAEHIDNKIVDLGGKPAFPADVSVGDIAAHYCPYYQDSTKLKEGDLVKIDIGVHIDGYLVDTAFTVSVGDNKVNKDLINAANSALNSALKLAKPGVSLGKIGISIEHEISSRGFKSIKNLSGHSVDRYTIHSGMSIPNFNSGSSKTLQKGQVVAIEPFASTGSGKVISGKSCKVFEVKEGKNTRQHRDVLKYLVGEYKTLPFSERNVIDKFGLVKARLALRNFVKSGVVEEYTVLHESKKGSLVAQAEHTVIVDDTPVVLT